MALHMEDRFPIIDILQQTPAIPDSCQWAIFLRNHDELTLEMVTDEERDYMYRVYAHDPQARINLGIRRRLGPAVGNNRRKIELMNGLLFSLPGTPVIYYGDEIGMGDNIYLGDRDGVRTPMQWSTDRNAGFSKATRNGCISPVDHRSRIFVQDTQRRAATEESAFAALVDETIDRPAATITRRSDAEISAPRCRTIPKCFRLLGITKGQTMLVVANLSRFTQFVELNFHQFAPCRPGRSFWTDQITMVRLPPYPMTLAPHVFHWFLLEREPASARFR